MQNQKRKQQKTLINENIEWILNLTDALQRQELQQSNLKQLPKAIMQNDYLLKSNVYTYCQINQKFILSQVALYPNMIIKDDQFLILSTCSIEKKRIYYKEFSAQGLLFTNSIGQTYLFFLALQDFTDWTKYAKKFCKLSNFLQKFTIKERTNVPNVFACVKNKTNSVFTVNIFRLQDFEKNPAVYEQLMNEINILMSLKHPCLLKYCAIYEDEQHLYLLYDYWAGDPLYKLIEQGLQLSSTQIAKITYQLLKFLKFIHIQNLYHAQITPLNIIVLRNIAVQELQIVLVNFAYREEIGIAQLIKKLPKQWIAPEMYNGQLINPPKIDSYQIGCTLFYLCVYKPKFKGSVQSFNKSIEHLDISQLRLEQEIALGEDSILSLSQIDLLKSLLNNDPEKRKDLGELCNHYWFVNENSKSKQIWKSQMLPSLRTILEIRESSSMEVKLSRVPESISIENFDSSDDDINFLDLVSEENNQLTAFIQALNSQNLSVHKC